MTDDWAAQKAREIMEEYRHRRILSDMPAQIWLPDEIAAALREVEARTVERCVEMLENGGVMLSLAPGETRHDRVVRYAKAMAAKIRAAFPASPKEPK